MEVSEARRLLGSWAELNLTLSRCRESEAVIPLLRFAVAEKVRWPVVERCWQRYSYLRRKEELALLRINVLPPNIRDSVYGNDPETRNT